jgi:hypothetical protein
VNITKWLKDRGFKLSAKGRRYGIRPRLVLDNVEILSADKHGIDIWVNNPDGQFGGPARRLNVSFEKFPQEVALALVEVLINTRKVKHYHEEEEPKTIRVPATFFNDHEERECEPFCEPVKRSSRFVWLLSNDPGLDELLSDAKHYSDEWGPDAIEDGGGLKRSAAATVKAIEAAQVKS